MQAQTVTHADTVSNALDLSTAEKARVDMPYMAELTGKIPCGGGFFVFMATTRIIPMHKTRTRLSSAQ